LTNAEEGV